jgi:hypothetical protein
MQNEKKATGYRPKAKGRKRRSGNSAKREKNVFLHLFAFFVFPIAYSLKPTAFFY